MAFQHIVSAILSLGHPVSRDLFYGPGIGIHNHSIPCRGNYKAEQSWTDLELGVKTTTGNPCRDEQGSAKFQVVPIL